MNHLLVSYHTCPLEEPGTGLAGGMNVFLRGLLPGLARHGIRTVVLTRGTRSSMPVIPVDWRIARRLEYGDTLVLVCREV